MSHKRASDTGPGVIYPDVEAAIQGYIDDLAYGGAGKDTAVSFHHLSCEIPEEDILNEDACTCLPLRFKLGDLARVGAKHAGSVIRAAGYTSGRSDDGQAHEPESA